MALIAPEASSAKVLVAVSNLTQMARLMIMTKTDSRLEIVSLRQQDVKLKITREKNSTCTSSAALLSLDYSPTAVTAITKRTKRSKDCNTALSELSTELTKPNKDR